MWLVTLLREAYYAPGHLREDHPFAVEDPLVNAAYLASTHALAEIAEIIGADPVPHRERAQRIRHALLDRLWDRDGGCFRALDLRSRGSCPSSPSPRSAPSWTRGCPLRSSGTSSTCCCRPASCGAAGYPVPTCDIQAPAFDRGGYWRGPTWINTNWLLWHGALAHGLPVIADLLYGATLRLVRQSGFREYFDPFDGTGRGGHDHSWSAAVVLDLLGARRAPWAA